MSKYNNNMHAPCDNDDDSDGDNDECYEANDEAMETQAPESIKLEPLNARLQSKENYTGPAIKPRTYQRELYLRVLEENSIICLGTGLGKTFIAVLYLNSPYISQQIQLNRKVAFLAASQDLLKQQALYFNDKVLYKVKIYCGKSAKCGAQIDIWDRNAWIEELRDYDVLFVIHDIFAAAIEKGKLNFEDFSAIVFDEAHHASMKTATKESNHAYPRILRAHEKFSKSKSKETPRPRLIGLTASLFNTKMPKNNIKEGLAYLERLFDGKCVTVLEVVENRPRSIVHTYPAPVVCTEDKLAEIFRAFIESLSKSLKHNTRARRGGGGFSDRLKSASAGISIKPADFPKILEDLLSLYSTCGAWMLRSVNQKLSKTLEEHQRIPQMSKDAIEIYQDFRETLGKINTALSSNLNRDPQSVLSYTRSKPKSLLDTLKKEYEKTADGSNGKSSFSCVIFVTSRLEVVALNSWLQEISSSMTEYSFIKCDYAIGQAGAATSPTSCITKRKPHEQSNMLAEFRKGHLNTIVTTAVLEEGIDLPVCSTVIRYDLPQNYRQFVQSRGRARQDVSSIIAICQDSEATNTIEKLKEYHQFELDLRDALGDRDLKAQVRQTQVAHEISSSDYKNYFVFGKDNLIIWPKVAKIIIDRYCNRLAQKDYFGNRLQIDTIELGDDKFQTILYPPTGCPLIEGIKGRVEDNKKLADDSAMLAFLRALDEAGELKEISAMLTGDKIDELLSSKGMRPDYDDLDKSLEGLSIGDGDFLFFEPELLRECNYLSKNCANRVYKLIKVAFSSNNPCTREATKIFFEKPIFGMIVDCKLDNNFIPPILYGHYGEFKVHSYVVSDNLMIKDESTHHQYLSYTHKLLQDCLAIRGISKKSFKEHCLFYMVPLDSTNNPDSSKMVHNPTSIEALKEIDIVKFSPQCKNHLGYKQQKNSLMLVRNTSVMNPKSKANPKFEFEPNIPYIEVMPISGQFASTSKSGVKLSKSDNITASLFYLRKFLVSSEYDAPTVLQSYLLPPIIYRLYITMMASNFDRKFVEDTREARHNFVKPTASDPPMVLDFTNLINSDDRTSAKVDDVNDDLLDHESSPIDDKLVDMAMEIEETVALNDSDDEDSPIAILSDSIVKQNLNQGMDVESSRQCQMVVNKPKDMDQLVHEIDRSTEQTFSELDTETMRALYDDLTPLRIKLTEGIRYFRDTMVISAGYLDEEVEFKKRSAKVDLTIKSPVYFDRNTTPLLRKTREESLIEALTHRKAGEAYNLEALENIGDSYLKYVVSVVLFKSFDGDEGILTSARSRLVSNKHFTHLAKKNNLGSLAITRNSFSGSAHLPYILGKQICTKEDRNRLYNKMRPKSLADSFESIIGGYLIYQGEFEAINIIQYLGLKLFQENIFDEFHERAVVFSGVKKSPIEDTPKAKDTYESCRQQVYQFERIIGYEFNDKSYLVQAFTHPSSVLKCTQSYERLEFLGDALLDILVTLTLIKTISNNNTLNRLVSPGQISSSRSALVSNSNLARLALTYRYDLFIQYSSRELFEELNKVRSAMEKDPSMVFLDMLDYDRIVKLLADSFESVAAAIYLDSGFSLDTVWKYYYPMLKESIDSEAGDPTKNAVQFLNEAFPGPGRVSFESYTIHDADGDSFGVCCKIHHYDSEESRKFKGQGMSKRQAKQRAVRLALKDIPTEGVRDRLKKLYYAKLSK